MTKDFDDANIQVEEHLLIQIPGTGDVLHNKRSVQQNNLREDKSHLRVDGHVLIRDAQTGEVLVDKPNAINNENMSQALAMSLSNRSSGFIDSMVFGNGATVESGTGAITYFPPNVSGPNAQLYNQTYSQVVNDNSALNVNAAANFLSVNHVAGNSFTDVIITCLLDYNEPSGQDVFDNAPNSNGLYIFNELGLRSFDAVSGNGLLLSHCIFHPVQKALNRTLQIIYTIRIFLA